MAQESTAVLSFTEEELLTLQAIAAGPEPHRQRARALLALASGKSPVQAARPARLRVTQVMYWRGRFRNAGLTIFPEALVAAASETAGDHDENVVPPTAKRTAKKKGVKKKDKAAGKKGAAKQSEKKDGKKKSGKKPDKGKKAGKKSAKEKKAGAKKKKGGAKKKS